MLTYRVDDMTCGHCVSAITKAVRATDPAAKVQADLAQHLVHIEPAGSDADALRDAITGAGYTPVTVQAGDQRVAVRSAGCCCGSGASSCSA